MRLMKYSLFFIFIIFKVNAALAQSGGACTTLGQKPSTAFPVCGIDTFLQTTVPYCVNKALPTPGCAGQTYFDSNPYYYRFTCYSGGSLEFLITPDNQQEDYDWQIFDITGKNPDDIFTDATCFLVANWAGTYGNTGTSVTALNSIECGSDPFQIPAVPTFSKSPILIEGHTYLLMISHYSQTPNGYKLSFGGGTASITDPITPQLNNASTSCDGSQITVKLSKKMKCSTLAANGSDFSIMGSLVNVVAAAGIGCSNGFDMDSVVLNLSSPLAPGNYSLVVKNGGDDNTLLDNCNQPIPVGNAIPFIVFGRQPTPFDSIVPVSCAPKVLQLSFRKNINCNSISPDGSDFQVTGPYPVTVTSASGSCTNGVSSSIFINLTAPVVHDGTYTITLVTGNDGNTIIDECGEPTPAGATINFAVKDTVSSAITYHLNEGCRYDTIQYFNPLANGKTQWNWLFDNITPRDLQNPTIIYSTFGDKTAQLIVSNGFCSDTSNIKIYLNHDSLRAAFTGPTVYCPNDIAFFRDTSIGTILAWNWEFGNGFTSTLQNPLPQYYPGADRDRLFPVRLIVVSDKFCTDTALKYIKVVNNCYIAVPSAFTPNKDGRNDYLYPLNAYKATNLMFKVYNKYGQQLFATSDWTRKWDGTIGGVDQPTGVYVWFLQYTDGNTGQPVFQKGTTVLIR